MRDTYARLIDTLESGAARYRIMDHVAVGGTEQASAVRGHPSRQAAKCLIVRLAVGRRARRYLLAVVPGDRRLDLERLRTLTGGTRAVLARRDIAEDLAGSVSGSIIPFSFDPALELIADSALLDTTELFFNAARLDRSVALRTDDYMALARPRIGRIAEPAEAVVPASAGRDA